jgi:hypothetical protein
MNIPQPQNRKTNLDTDRLCNSRNKQIQSRVGVYNFVDLDSMRFDTQVIKMGKNCTGAGAAEVGGG